MLLEILENSQKNTCARVSFLIKLQAEPATLLKKRLWNRCFPVNFVKFLRTPFLQNTSRRLLVDLLQNLVKFLKSFKVNNWISLHPPPSLFFNDFLELRILSGNLHSTCFYHCFYWVEREMTFVHTLWNNYS